MKQLPHNLSSDHSLQWNDQLQNWLDGELNTAESAVFEAHLRGCEECQQTVEVLEELDVALVKATPPMELDAGFDEQLFAKIDAIDDQKRLEARQRMEREWHEQMEGLARNWRRSLAFVIPGVIAGIAIAFGLLYWLDSSGLTTNLMARGASQVGTSFDTMRLIFTTVVGAGMGLTAAPWLARLAD